MCLAQGPQHSDAGEARNRGPRSRVKHSTTEPLRSHLTKVELNILLVPCTNVKISVSILSVKKKKKKKKKLIHLKQLSEQEASMANSVDPDQTAPIGAVCSGSTLFATLLNLSVMLGSYLQQTTSAFVIFRCLFSWRFKCQHPMSVDHFVNNVSFD